MRRFLAELLDVAPSDGRCEFVSAFAKPYPSQVIATVMGAPLQDAPRQSKAGMDVGEVQWDAARRVIKIEANVDPAVEQAHRLGS